MAIANFALAETCPSNTMVTGTTVVFVGELTDMGGDPITYVWFEYGQTIGYGQKTIEKALPQTGFYCITISGLLPSTTYHYRAVARNSASTSYGEDKSFTTVSGPSVDLRVNGYNGPISVPYNGSVNLTWYSSNVDSCYASNGWSGSKSVSGSESRTNLTFSKTYTITCSGSGGSVSDSVSINVDGYQNDNPPIADAGPNKSVYEDQTVTLNGSGYDPDGGSVTYYWSCSGGYLNYRYTAQPVFDAPLVSYNRNYTCTLTVTDNEGYTDSDSMTVSVRNRYDDDEDVELKVSHVVKNVSDGDTIWYNSLYADPGDDLLFRITVKSISDDEARDVRIENVLPSKIVYKGNLRINGVYSSVNINTNSVDIGDLSPNQTKIITFEGRVKSISNFDYGITNLISSATAYNSETSDTDTCKIMVRRKSVAGVTDIRTGIDSKLFSSLLFPLGIAMLMTIIFKSQLIGFDKWSENRKKQVQEYRNKKLLRKRINELKL
ncbi:hypothetical protein E3V08_05175 [Candidatus Atribacteria bacterium MT.SAG.1]|nr:hypothetical protein E3V08_05175 [Candidatus Atribacteria bacterium MT.SAG.1]